MPTGLSKVTVEEVFTHKLALIYFYDICNSFGHCPKMEVHAMIMPGRHNKPWHQHNLSSLFSNVMESLVFQSYYFILLYDNVYM